MILLMALAFGFQQAAHADTAVIFLEKPARFNATEAASGLTMVLGVAAILTGIVTLCEDSCDADKKSNGFIALCAGAALIGVGALIKK